MADAPRKETISSRLSAALRQDILRGDLAPGSHINLDRLRAAHDVSISPLREAVARLAAEGLVEFEDQKGFRVAPVSAADLDEVTRMRALLEGMAVEVSVTRGTLDWESEVMRALHVLDHTPHAPAEPWEEAHAAFHRALIGGCAMPLLLRQCAMLHHLTERYRRLFPAPPDAARAEEHRAMARAATARDASGAAALLWAHVLATGAALRARVAAG